MLTYLQPMGDGSNRTINAGQCSKHLRTSHYQCRAMFETHMHVSYLWNSNQFSQGFDLLNISPNIDILPRSQLSDVNNNFPMM